MFGGVENKVPERAPHQQRQGKSKAKQRLVCTCSMVSIFNLHIEEDSIQPISSHELLQILLPIRRHRQVPDA